VLNVQPGLASKAPPCDGSRHLCTHPVRRMDTDSCGFRSPFTRAAPDASRYASAALSVMGASHYAPASPSSSP
jgi:hypothetical protein